MKKSEKMKRKKKARREARRKRDYERLLDRLQADDAWENRASIQADAEEILRDMGGGALEAATAHAAQVRQFAEEIRAGMRTGDPIADAALQLSAQHTGAALQKRFLATDDPTQEFIYELAVMLKVLEQEKSEPGGFLIEGNDGVSYKFSCARVNEAWECAMQAAAFSGGVRVNGETVDIKVASVGAPGWRGDFLKADAAMRAVFNRILRENGREDMVMPDFDESCLGGRA